MPDRVFVIAEAGVNHNSSLDAALRLVDTAADAGADAVKFQTFRADEIAVPELAKAAYQAEATDAAESQTDMLRRLELPLADHARLADHCRERGIEFMSTAFDDRLLRFLVEETGIRRIKIPSGEIDNLPLLACAAASGLPIVLSTGMSTIGDVALALAVLAIGAPASLPSHEDLRKAANEEDFRRLTGRVTLLQCTSSYPAPAAAMNLLAMATLRERFRLPVGLSDHSLGINAAIAATALGASVIEKHFTLDRNQQGPDHAASLEPGELAAMIEGIRETEAMLGSPDKRPGADELRTREVVRKRLVAARPIRAGETITEEDIAIKRAPSGLSPLHFRDIVGTPASRNFAKDEPILA